MVNTRWAFGPLALFIGLFASAAGAQNAEQPRGPVVGDRVAATVNDEPISTFDVQQRMMLLMVTSGAAEIPQEAMGQFQQQALRDLIEEHLKMQEAERFDLTISDDEVNAELAQIAASGGATVPELVADLQARGIAVESLRQKIRAQKAWEQLVAGRYGSRVKITEREVDSMLDDMREQVQQPQYLLAEICLPLESESQRDQMMRVGLQMIDQMRQGVPFRALAQQFSTCGSAARGGDLGWMSPGDLDPDLANIIPQLGEGAVSRPIPVDGMLKLIAVRQERQAATAGEPSYQVAYAGAPTNAVNREAAAEALSRIAQTNACNGGTLSIDLGPSIGVATLPMMPEGQFETVFHDVLADLEVGATSEVIESEGAYHVVQLCEKDEGFGLPSRRVVENRLEAEELELMARRYLRDVERDSAVDIRLGGDS